MPSKSNARIGPDVKCLEDVMFVVTVVMHVKPECVEQFHETIVQHAQNSFDNEIGCQAFDVSVSRDNSATYFAHVIYDAESDFEAHLVSDHTEWCREIILDLLESYELLKWTKVSDFTRVVNV